MSVNPSYEELERYGRQADITIENLQMQLNAEREAKLALAAENAGLKSIQAWAVADVFKSGAKRFESTKAAGFDTDDCLHDAVLVMLSELKTPATDAFLAEVRAQAKADGVQEYADSFRHSASKIRECHGDTIRVRALLHEANNADEFAAQLRIGVQS